MKTNTYLTILLALSIQVMVNGQTQGNPVTTNTNKSVNNPGHKDSSEKKISSVAGKKILMTLEASGAITTQTNKAPSTSQTHFSNVNKVTPTLNSATIEDLLNLAENLAKQAQQLRQEAKTKTPPESKKLLSEARNFDQKALTWQLEASKITEKLNLKQFDSNKITIKIMISNYNGEKSTLVYSYNLIIESEKDMKLAKEMREEAYSQPTLAAKIGNMSNAEEKELLALNKQSQVIGLLGKTTLAAGNTR